MKILAIIPAFNEEKKIEETVALVKRINKSVDVLVVNDGSLDKTESILEKIRVKYVSHPYNLGYGVAIQTGYKFAYKYDYDLVVQLDADGQHDPRYIEQMVVMMKEKKMDVVVGSRFMENTGYHAPLSRKIGMVFFSFIVSMVTHRKVTDSTSGYQLIDKKVLPFLCSDQFPCDYPDADLLIMLYFAGFRVGEFSMKMAESETGKSMHGSIVRNIYYVLKMCLSIFTILLRKVTGLPNC